MTRSSYLSSFRIVSLALLSAYQMAGMRRRPPLERGHSIDGRVDITAALVACGLDDGTIALDSTLRACDPHDSKKTTICHIRPVIPPTPTRSASGMPPYPPTFTITETASVRARRRLRVRPRP